MKYFYIILSLLMSLPQTLLGQTDNSLFNQNYRKVYKIKQGRTVYVQHLSDAPGEVRRCKILDLNDSLITLKSKNAVLIFPNKEIVGCWVIDSKAKAKMVVKGTLGLSCFFVGFGLFVASYNEDYFFHAINISGMAVGLYGVYQARPKANATKVNLSKDKIYFKRHAY
jgi:hypothetical protein